MPDDSTFERILTETQLAIRAFIAGTGISRDSVDDVAQEVYVDFYRGMAAMPEGVLPLKWLKGIARHKCLDHFRRQQRKSDLHRRAIAECLAQEESDCEALLAKPGLVAALRACVDKLPAGNRKLVTLYYREENTSERVGDLVGLTAASVRKNLLRIRDKLKGCIERSLARERTVLG
ncbi:MAG: sigma-70 family RNA polymerase sigma factor [Kiritimatiellae bacterium]|nr:sigma-70 family RNA polymerase sigma factor [Kiritimatiellia bacterium]